MENKIFKQRIFILLFLLFSDLLFGLNSFETSKIRQAELRLYFTSPIERVTYFAIPVDENITKYVYDIYGAVLPMGKGISHHTFRTIKSFKIAQNQPTKLRVVIESTEKALDKQEFQGRLLAIPLIAGRKVVGIDRSTNSSKSSSDSSKNSSIESNISTVTLSAKQIKPKIEEEAKVPVIASPSSFRGYTVVIDAGHGGKDVGAICSKKKMEKKVTLSVSLKLKKKLEAKGYKVYMTRDDDSFVKLPKRTEFANKKKADIFISIHANAAPSKEEWSIFKGIEIYYLSPAKTQRAKEAAEKENAVMFEDTDKYTKNQYLSLLNREKIIESHKLGLDVSYKILKTLRKHFGSVSDGGVKTANFWVLVGAQMPAILVEIGYITHPTEGENLLNNYYKELLAKGIADGIERYLNNR